METKFFHKSQPICCKLVKHAIMLKMYENDKFVGFGDKLTEVDQNAAYHKTCNHAENV